VLLAAKDGKIQAQDLIADVTIGELPVKVLTGSHKFLFNMMLSIFAKRLKETVSHEVRRKFDESVLLLEEKIADVAARFSPEIT